jgi:hypothetical protein
MPAIVRTIPMATVAHTILRSAALADSTIARLTTTAATAATRNQATVEAAAIPSRAAIPRRQLLLVLTRVPRVHTLRLAAVMAAVAAAVLAAAVVAEARTRPLVEAGLVVVEAALTAVVVAATPVVATNQRTY